MAALTLGFVVSQKIPWTRKPGLVFHISERFLPSPALITHTFDYPYAILTKKKKKIKQHSCLIQKIFA